MTNQLITFGPVPSRRLGRSLGINNIPAKLCTYSCIYCQLGTTKATIDRRGTFYNTKEIISQVMNHIDNAIKHDESIDYLTFVADGEPTLDLGLEQTIEALKETGFPIAVITNGSLLWDRKVSSAVAKADWVSIKIDAVSPEIWQKINNPHHSLKLDLILLEIMNFSRIFSGVLTSETMLIKDVNDSPAELRKIADFVSGLNTTQSYLSIPTRPPAKKWAVSASELTLNQAYQIFQNRQINTEYLIGYEGNAFGSTGDLESDILNITAVHPMREEAVQVLLKKQASSWKVVADLIKQGKLTEINYG
ncbi:MAG: radical SAM protein, partial [Candidatus Marinimicrobia bacterium]|nr:radical SAM protein [Candidatus Neomarinimicrobiota bacterium]